MRESRPYGETAIITESRAHRPGLHSFVSHGQRKFPRGENAAIALLLPVQVIKRKAGSIRGLSIRRLQTSPLRPYRHQYTW
jgi:hypothetical protein